MTWRILWLVLVPAALASGCVGHPQASPRTTAEAAAAPVGPDSTYNPSEIAQLVRGLGGSREATRHSRERLTEIGPPAVPALLEALSSADFSTRWGAVNVLGYIQDKRALGPLVQLVLRDPNNHVRWRSIWAISQMHDETSAEELRRGLRSDDTIRWNAAVALSTLGDTEALPILVDGLTSSSSWRKWEAVNALGRIHDAGTATALAPLLKDGDPRIRQEVALSLGSIGGDRAIQALEGALEDSHAGVRWRAAMALSRTGASSAVPALEGALRKETDTFAKEQFEKALAKLRDPGRRP